MRLQIEENIYNFYIANPDVESDGYVPMILISNNFYVLYTKKGKSPSQIGKFDYSILRLCCE